MNRLGLALGCASLVARGLAGSLGGCGGDDSSSTIETGDAAADTASSSSSSSSGSTSSSSSSGGTTDGGVDGAPPPNPEKITCGSAECDTPQVCCAAPAPADGGITYTCQPEGTNCTGAKVGCDEKADCTGQDVCCMSVSGTPLSSTCKASCGAQDVQLCKSTADCATCQEYSCPLGRKVFACSKPFGCN